MQVNAKNSDIMGKIEVVDLFDSLNHNNIEFLLLSWTQGEIKVTLRIFSLIVLTCEKRSSACV